LGVTGTTHSANSTHQYGIGLEKGGQNEFDSGFTGFTVSFSWTDLRKTFAYFKTAKKIE